MVLTKLKAKRASKNSATASSKDEGDSPRLSGKSVDLKGGRGDPNFPEYVTRDTCVPRARERVKYCILVVKFLARRYKCYKT